MTLEMLNGTKKDQIDHAIKKSGGYIYKLVCRTDGVHLEELKIIYANNYYIYLKISGNKILCPITWDNVIAELNETALLEFIDYISVSHAGRGMRVGCVFYYFTCPDISKMKKMLSEFNGNISLVALEAAIRQEEQFIEAQQKIFEKAMNESRKAIQDLKTKREKLLKKQKGEDAT